MGMFGLGKKDSEENGETGKSSVWASQLAAATADARKSSVEAEKGNPGKRKTAQKPDSGGSVSRELEEKAAQMFSPEAWRSIVKMPFALGKVMTGRKCWDLEQKQEDTLATTTSATAEYFLQVDPKYVVLTLFLMNWGAVLTEKFTANAVERQKELASEPPSSSPPHLRPVA
jgi:hypothetical protein